MSEVLVRRRRSRAEAEALVAEFEASGLMREAFCRQRGLAVGTLDKYRRRVRGEEPSIAGRMVSVEVVRSPARVGSSDIDGHSAFVVELRSGYRIDVHRGFDAGTLERLVTLLDKA